MDCTVLYARQVHKYHSDFYHQKLSFYVFFNEQKPYYTVHPREIKTTDTAQSQ